MNQYPAKPLMDEMARYGRYGDSMLVHMNPVEVAGIASLTPGGLTKNPVTGQPEAFGFLAPMLLGAAGITMTPLASAALVGGITAIQEKDLGKGVLAGIGGLAAGALGEKLGNLFGMGTDAATQTTLNTGLDAAKTGLEAGLDAAAGTSDLALQQAMEGASGTLEAGMERALSTPMSPSPLTQSVTQGLNVDQLAGVAPENLFRGAPLDMASPAPSIASRINEGVRNLGTMGNLGILGVSQGALGDIEMREKQRAQGEALRAKREEKLNQARSDLAGAMSLAGQRSEMGRTVRMQEGGSTDSGAKVTQTLPEQEGFIDPLKAARFFGIGDRGYGGLSPAQVQANLRGIDVIAPPKDYMPGLEPEFSYFQTLERDDAGNIIGTPQVPDRSYRPMRTPSFSQGPYFDPILQSPQSNAQLQEFRRTLAALDPGPTDLGSVLGIAAEGARLTPQQQAVFEEYYSQPKAPATTTETTTDDSATTTNTSFQVNDAIRNYFPDMTDQEIADLLESYQSGNIFTLADNVSNPDVANILSASLYAGLGPNDVSPLGNPETLMAMYPNLTEAQAKAIAELSINPLPFKGGGLAGGRNDEVMLETSLGTTSVPSGGIAQVPTEFTQGSRQPDVERDIQALEAAVLGRVNKVLGEQITNMFVQKYGPDVYRVARESILRRSTPNAQTEGMISGQGSGMDDMVQGMIGDEQPVAVSPGEFIVPADVVSGLGEGSSDAGAKKLDEMMDRVRMERNGTTKQAPQIDERKMMPA
tara:strand:- start:2392 stop:4665 length:2274 start_codon:yes stop_codon:yes gene_type:complete